MSYQLNKPYTTRQRADFIVNYNHQNGLTIEETALALYALEANEIMQDGEPIVNPDYEKEQEEKRKEHIQALTCTKRDFALILQKFGISYSQLKELIATNDNAQLEWDLCTGLLRSNPLIDLMAEELGVSSEQLDNLFLYANGELTDKELALCLTKMEDK
jgi:NACalpha-BTF3-like transcription factor